MRLTAVVAILEASFLGFLAFFASRAASLQTYFAL